MPEFNVLEAKVNPRVPAKIAPVAEDVSFGRSVGQWLSGPVFSRARDIFAANMAELLDRSEDPAKLIRMIILEMEETLVELRAAAARSIADVKELRSALGRLEDIQSSWSERAQLALEKDRDDLARQALAERQKAACTAEGIAAEALQIEAVLKGYEADIARLQAKLREARARRNSVAARFEIALARAKVSEAMYGSRAEDAFARFELLERRADFAEGRADALALAAPYSLEDEIAELKAAEEVDDELARLKARLAARTH